MKVLGIDQSLKSTGLCLVDSSGKILSRKIIEIDKTDVKKEIDKRFEVHKNETVKKVSMCEYVVKQITDFIRVEEPDVIIIEGLAFGIKGDATRTLGALQFMIISDIMSGFFHMSPNRAEESIEIVAPTSLKKFATGKGSGSKEDLFEALPDEVKDDFSKFPKTRGRYDLTDAYWLSQWGVENNHATR